MEPHCRLTSVWQSSQKPHRCHIRSRRSNSQSRQVARMIGRTFLVFVHLHVHVVCECALKLLHAAWKTPTKRRRAINSSHSTPLLHGPCPVSSRIPFPSEQPDPTALRPPCVHISLKRKWLAPYLLAARGSYERSLYCEMAAPGIRTKRQRKTSATPRASTSLFARERQKRHVLSNSRSCLTHVFL